MKDKALSTKCVCGEKIGSVWRKIMSVEVKNLFSLSKRIIVITGAAGLLGRQHAIAVAAAEGVPVLLDLNEDAVISLAKEINDEYNVDAIGLKLDVTDETCVSQVCKEILVRFGKIDGLINNAANNPKIENKNGKNFSRFENFPIDIWHDDISVCLTGSYLCTKYFGYEISKNKEGGSIVNISSDLGLIGPDQRLYEVPDSSDKSQPVKPVTYSVSKAGLLGLTRYTATYWADKNVRCNAICPGGVHNDQKEEFLNRVSFRIPMNRLAKESEYQGTIIWMLSDASSYLNGAIVPVDGGRTAW